MKINTNPIASDELHKGKKLNGDFPQASESIISNVSKVSKKNQVKKNTGSRMMESKSQEKERMNWADQHYYFNLAGLSGYFLFYFYILVFIQ